MCAVLWLSTYHPTKFQVLIIFVCFSYGCWICTNTVARSLQVAFFDNLWLLSVNRLIASPPSLSHSSYNNSTLTTGVELNRLNGDSLPCELREDIVCVLFDYKKAFDSVPHWMLMECLSHLELHPLISSWLCSNLSNRQEFVRVSGENSPSITVFTLEYRKDQCWVSAASSVIPNLYQWYHSTQSFIQFKTTIFTWIVAVATIYFILLWVQLLLKGGYYTRAALISNTVCVYTSFR